MNAAYHSIGRQIFELDVGNRKDADFGYEELMQLFRNRLLEEMEKILTDFAPSGRSYHFNRIELDIGVLSKKDFQQIAGQRIREALIEALEQKIPVQDNKTDSDQAPSLDLIRVFLRKGHLPWWKSSHEPRLISRLLAELAEEHPKQLIRLLKTEIRNLPAIAERLRLQLDTAGLSLLRRLLIRDTSPVGITARTLSAFYQQLPPGRLPARFQVSHEIEFVLLYMGLLYPELPAVFLRLWAEHLAASTRRTPASVLADLKTDLKDSGLPPKQKSSLAKVVRELASTVQMPLPAYKEFPDQKTTAAKDRSEPDKKKGQDATPEKTGNATREPPHPDGNPAPGSKDKQGFAVATNPALSSESKQAFTEDTARLLIFYLLHGHFPESTVKSEKNDPDQLFQSLEGPVFEAFKAGFLRLANDIAVMRRVQSQFSPASQLKILAFLTGVDWKTFLDLAAGLDTLFRRQPLSGLPMSDLPVMLEEEVAQLFLDRPKPEEARMLLLQRLGSRITDIAGMSPDHLSGYFQALISQEERYRLFGGDIHPPRRESAADPVSGSWTGRIESWIEEGHFTPDEQFPTPIILEHTLIRQIIAGDKKVIHLLVSLLEKQVRPNVGPELLQTLARAVAGDKWEAMAAATEDLQLIYGQSPMDGFPLQAFQALLFRVLIQRHKGASTSTDLIEFWQTVLQQVAAETHMAPARLQTRFQEQIRSFGSPAAFKTTLPFNIQTEPLPPAEEREWMGERKAYFHFLQYGTWPAGEIVPGPAGKEAFFGRMLRESPEEMRRLCLELREKTNLAQRLVTFLNLPTVDLLILSLTGGPSPAWKQLLKDLDRLTKEKTGLKGLPFRRVELREYLLQAILRDLRGGPDLLRSVRHLFTQLSRDTGLQPAVFLADLEKLALKKPFSADFRSLVQRTRAFLSPEMLQEVETFLAAEKLPDPKYITTDAVLHFLHTGEIPWWAPDLEPQNEVTTLLEKDRAGFKKEFAPFIRQSGWIGKWIKGLEKGPAERFISAAAGEYAGILAAFTDILAHLYKTRVLRKKNIWETIRDQALVTILTAPARIRTEDLVGRWVRELARAEGRQRSEITAVIKPEIEARIRGKDARFFRLSEILDNASTPENAGDPAIRHLPHPAPPDDTSNIHGTDFAETEQKMSGAPEKAAELGYAETVKNGLAAFRYYLLTGGLSRLYAHWRRDDLGRLQADLATSEPAFYKPYLLRLLDRPAAAKRLAEAFPALRLPLAYLLWGPDMPWILEILKTIGTSEGNKNIQDRASFFQHLFSFAGRTQHTALTAESYFWDLAGFLAAEEKMPPVQWLNRLIKRLEVTGGPPAAISEVIKAAEKRAASMRMNAANQKKKTMDQSKTRQTETEGQGEYLYIHNAGLVILAPFLPRFFDLLKMTSERAFVSEAAAIRGVHLLQYLTTGLSETPEHMLVFNKILCGLPLETPLPLSIELTEEEEDICGQLLNSVLQNWEMMKNSTVENLRATFLIREGRLAEMKDSWQLKVESKSFDILLEYLSWTISMVKLPWMTNRIEVEWKKNN